MTSIRSAGTVVLLRDLGGEQQVLLLRRNSRVGFAGGAWVFPGGAVDVVHDDKVIATFASVFPAHDPKYVLVVSLDEPEVFTLGETRRTAGWTAVPVAAELIRRVAPLLGLRPEAEPGQLGGVTQASN